MILIEFFLTLFVASIAAGALGSVVGIGGGPIVIPILTLFLGVDIHYANGASIVWIIATSSGAAAANPETGLAGMLAAGLISGLLGIGSGTFKVLSMDIVMKLPMKVSTTTSNFMIGVTAAASAGIYFARGDVNPLITAPVALGIL